MLAGSLWERGAAIDGAATAAADATDATDTTAFMKNFLLLTDGTAPPAGSVGIAGADTSALWPGYMDGAVRSGERAAHEALAGL